MTRSSPAKALNGARTGHICDRCNARVNTGDAVRAYATHYDRDGWVLRRVWCSDCGESTIESETEGAAEAIVEAVFWEHRLAGVEARDVSL